MKKNLTASNLTSGFTLLELMVVITVIGILATMVLFGLTKSQAAARDAQRQQSMTGIQAALERYYSDCQAYPNTNYAGLLAASGSTTCGTSLVQGGYLTAAPTDPGGTAPTYYYESPNGTNCTGSALPNGYELWFVKESGGSSYFCSP